MAECSYSRCIQQKRYIRRELQRWTKNMVYIVGLERIAEELMGRRKWKLYQESMSRSYLQPINNNVEKITRTCDDEFLKDYHHHRDFSDSNIKQFQKVLLEQKGVKEQIAKEEEERLKDWIPEDKCYFCVDGKLDSENNTSHGALSPRQTDSDSSDSHSDLEAPPTLTPPTPGLRLNNNHANMTTIESVTSMAALASAVAAFSGNPPATPTPPLSCYPPYLLPPNWYLANVARSFQHERLMENLEKPSSEQPLDLSSKSTTCSSSPVENKMSPNLRLPTLDSKQIFKAKPRMSAIAGRRTYTEDELQAALRDIQSGKLGTRRAAVIYGIPRSTLRNKVYKLAMERERESHLNSTTPLKIEEEEVVDEDKELSGAEEEKEVEKALQAPLLSMADILRFSNIENQEALKNILHQEHSAVGPYIQNILMNSSGGVITKNHQLNNGERSPSNLLIPKLERSESSDMETDESPSNVILKIPSFKPTTNSTSSRNGSDFYRSPPDSSIPIISPHSESGSPPILPGRGMTLKDVKDVIAKSISQKFQQTPEPLRMPPMMEMDYKRSGFTPPMGMMKNHSYSTHSPKLPSAATSSSTGGKGTRPKRGKYRNYDRDSLVEAVRAVQRGEMSVHRAGSYYGVPHSTLEYKVKERHLMRPRKRDPKPNPVDEKLASLKQNDLRIADKIMKPIMKPPQPKFSPTSPNGMKLPIFDPNMASALGYNPPPFPFWPHPGFSHIPLDYGRNPSTSSTFPPSPEQFFASQMMQKLQEESIRTQPNNNPSAPLPKNTRQIAESLLDGVGPNGSFLDGIIRSSLESGVPVGSEEVKIKDERNLTPEHMSNKALLDQLCRNSRLTPLPKPESNSSGDENVHTIELSNDSTSSGRDDEHKSTLPGRIYLKQDLVNPENLKPEMLIRYRGDIDSLRNGGIEGSASESDVAQD